MVCPLSGRSFPRSSELICLEAHNFDDSMSCYINKYKAICFYIFYIKLTLDGLKGPAKALTAITGSFGLLGNRGERDSIGSGDQGAPITAWEELSVARSNGMYNRSVANQNSILDHGMHRIYTFKLNTKCNVISLPSKYSFIFCLTS